MSEKGKFYFVKSMKYEGNVEVRHPVGAECDGSPHDL